MSVDRREPHKWPMAHYARDQAGLREGVSRVLPEELAIAFNIEGTTHAVMMASPEKLEDFAIGFLFCEGIIERASNVLAIDPLPTPLGIDVQIRLDKDRGERFQSARIARIGPVGCGLCGVESLELAIPDFPALEGTANMDFDMPFLALENLAGAQASRARSGAMHGAALVDPKGKIGIAREDIGRHNALDKVIGAALRQGPDTLTKAGALVISSRVSVDLVIKAARARIPLLIGRASPSTLALEAAKKWGIAIIAPVFASEYFVGGEICKMG